MPTSSRVVALVQSRACDLLVSYPSLLTWLEALTGQLQALCQSARERQQPVPSPSPSPAVALAMKLEKHPDCHWPWTGGESKTAALTFATTTASASAQPRRRLESAVDPSISLAQSNFLDPKADIARFTTPDSAATSPSVAAKDVDPWDSENGGFLSVYNVRSSLPLPSLPDAALTPRSSPAQRAGPNYVERTITPLVGHDLELAKEIVVKLRADARRPRLAEDDDMEGLLLTQRLVEVDPEEDPQVSALLRAPMTVDEARPARQALEVGRRLVTSQSSGGRTSLTSGRDCS